MLGLTVLILTHNEEENIARCIQSCIGRFDEIVVIDSGSNDKTKSIVKTFPGVLFYKTIWRGYAGQRNWAMNELDLKNDWVIWLDADEEFTLELFNELKICFPEVSHNYKAISFKRRDIIFGKHLQSASEYGLDFVRILHRKFCSIKRDINEIYSVNGSTFSLKNAINHYPMSKGMEYWFFRHIKYAKLEANENELFDKSIRIRLKYLIISKWYGVFLLNIYYLLIKGALFKGKEEINFVKMKILYFRMIKLFRYENRITGS